MEEAAGLCFSDVDLGFLHKELCHLHGRNRYKLFVLFIIHGEFQSSFLIINKEY